MRGWRHRDQTRAGEQDKTGRMEIVRKEQGGVLDRGWDMTDELVGFPSQDTQEDAAGEDAGPVPGSCYVR